MLHTDFATLRASGLGVGGGLYVDRPHTHSIRSGTLCYQFIHLRFPCHDRLCRTLFVLPVVG